MTTATVREPKKYVDFARIPPSQWKMHDRLEGWARWCRGGSGESARTDASPMFGLYRSSEAKQVERLYGGETSVPIDKHDAARLNDAIGKLPELHRRSIHWFYLKGRSPKSFAMSLMVPLPRLAELVIEARAQLIEVGV